MLRIAEMFVSELKEDPWNSPLQLAIAGLILYYVSMVVGSGYACGIGNNDLAKGVFRCAYGEMQTYSKVFIVLGIGVASLCMGRAVSILEKRRFGARD